MRGSLRLAEACVPVICSALASARAPARAAAKEGEQHCFGRFRTPALPAPALTRPPLCLLSPKGLFQAGDRARQTSLPPGLWHALPISQSVHTGLLSATQGTDSQALGAPWQTEKRKTQGDDSLVGASVDYTGSCSVPGQGYGQSELWGRWGGTSGREFDLGSGLGQGKLAGHSLGLCFPPGVPRAGLLQ